MADIENFRFHDLRHTFATRLVQSGVDIYKVKKLLGHSTITVTISMIITPLKACCDRVKVLDILYYLLCYRRRNPIDLTPKKPLKSSQREWRSWQTRRT